MDYEDCKFELETLTSENYQPCHPYDVIITEQPQFCSVCMALPFEYFLLTYTENFAGEVYEHTSGIVCADNNMCLYNILEAYDNNGILQAGHFRLRKVRNIVKAHPELQRKPISLTTRYNVLRRDGFQCVACGASGKVAQLEVDHICPVSKGGSNHESNLQTLCFNCNRGKRDRL